MKGAYQSYSPPALPLFFHKVSVGHEGGCWVWDSYRTVGGYGRVTDRGRAVYAHRFSYQTFVGPIAFGLQLDHLCRNRACVNPDHLEPVTNRENALRGAKATRTHCANGHSFAEHAVIYRGYRRCTECRRMHNARRHDNRRDAA